MPIPNSGTVKTQNRVILVVDQRETGIRKGIKEDKGEWFYDSGLCRKKG